MSSVRYELRGATALITLDYPPVNGLGAALRSGIVQALEQALADGSVQAIVLAGSERAFSGGADVKEFGTPLATQEPRLPTVIAALENAARLTGRTLPGLKTVISGAGAAGTAVAQILREAGVADIVVVDSQGVLGPDRAGLNDAKAALAAASNPRGLTGTVAEALVGADVFIGVSGGTISESAIAGMAADAIIFSLANPTPEIHPEVARKYAAVVATGRSDFPNQINNVLAFPGLFRGALDVQARKITPNMHLAAADAIAAVVGDRVAPDYIVPSPFDRRVAVSVAAAVSAAATADGVARISL